MYVLNLFLPLQYRKKEQSMIIFVCLRLPKIDKMENNDLTHLSLHSTLKTAAKNLQSLVPLAAKTDS